MTVKITIRSRRLAYMILLLVLAVALTTVLVLAGERGAEGLKENTSQNNWNATVATQQEARVSACMQA
jgi:putative copper export protein